MEEISNSDTEKRRHDETEDDTMSAKRICSENVPDLALSSSLTKQMDQIAQESSNVCEEGLTSSNLTGMLVTEGETSQKNSTDIEMTGPFKKIDSQKVDINSDDKELLKEACITFPSCETRETVTSDEMKFEDVTADQNLKETNLVPIDSVSLETPNENMVIDCNVNTAVIDPSVDASNNLLIGGLLDNMSQSSVSMQNDAVINKMFYTEQEKPLLEESTELIESVSTLKALPNEIASYSAISPNKTSKLGEMLSDENNGSFPIPDVITNSGMLKDDIPVPASAINPEKQILVTDNPSADNSEKEILVDVSSQKDYSEDASQTLLPELDKKNHVPLAASKLNNEKSLLSVQKGDHDIETELCQEEPIFASCEQDNTMGNGIELDKKEGKKLDEGSSIADCLTITKQLVQDAINSDDSAFPLKASQEGEDIESLPVDNEVSLSDKNVTLDLRASLLASKVGELCQGNDSQLTTPCDSSGTSTMVSTPVGSCHASAAPSPKHFEVISKDTMLNSGQSTPVVPRKIGGKRKKGKSRRVSKPIVVDEETRMDANTLSSVPELPIDEDSQSSTGTSSKKETRRFRCEVIVPESTEDFTVEKVIEYIWPMEGMGEHYFIQEHMSQYLGIMSFKRKYPDLRRRPIESQEKEYLKGEKIVSEMACDLGLTAVRSEDVLDVMFNDFPLKYEELTKTLRERKEKKLKEENRLEYQVIDLDKSRMHEYSKKAAKGAAKWNAHFNRERKEERRYSFDLQTFTVHCPENYCKKLTPEITKKGSYPVTVLPGQYADYYKDYNTLELRAMPLNTVLYGPFTADELDQSPLVESEDDSISAGTACEETSAVDVEPLMTTIDPLSAEKLPRCKICNGGRDRNKIGRPEPLIICGSCRTPSHPTCVDLTLTMVPKIESYAWQCMECKTCAQCNDPDDEERMIFCDMCDRGYHIYCVGLRKVPNGRWHCKVCAHCFSCGSRAPSGNEPIKNAEWQHEFRKEKDKKELKYACTLCVPCDKYWKRRQFCHVCLKVYKSIPEDGMIRCSGCPKYVHRDGGCSTQQENERYCANCMKGRRKTALNHSRILAAAKKKMATGY